MRQSKKLKVGLIGLGWMGSKYEGIIKANKFVEFLCCCDTDQTKLKLHQRNFQKLYTDYNKMLYENKLDILVIASPNKYHVEHVNKAARQVGNILLEKPLSNSLIDAEYLLKVLYKSKVEKNILVNYHHRTNPLNIKLKNLLKTNSIGNILHYDLFSTKWFRGDSYYKNKMAGFNGLLINQAIHDIDLLLWFFGSPCYVGSSCRSYIKKKPQIDNELQALFIYPNGLTGNLYEANHIYPCEYNLKIFGDQGYIKVENNKLFLKRYKDKISNQIKIHSGFLPPKISIKDKKIFCTNWNDDKGWSIIFNSLTKQFEKNFIKLELSDISAAYMSLNMTYALMISSLKKKFIQFPLLIENNRDVIKQIETGNYILSNK